MAFDVLLVPRAVRRLDFALAALRVAGVVALAARLVGPMLEGLPAVPDLVDAALLLGVVTASLVRVLVLWPQAVRQVAPDRATRLRAWWPAPVVSLGGRELCPASWDSLGALGIDSWWGRYRVLVLQAGLRGAVTRALVALLSVAALTAPVFFLQQSIEYGSPTGAWDASGFSAWARALVKAALAVALSATVWWALLVTAVHAAWALRSLSSSRPGAATRLLPRVAWVAWVAAPLALLLRQAG